MIDTSGPAFPNNMNADGGLGISKRDYMAAAALTGLMRLLTVPGLEMKDDNITLEMAIAQQAYEFADAMIAVSNTNE